MKDKQNQFQAQPQNSQTSSSQPGNTLQGKEVSPSLPQDWHAQRQDSFNGSVYLSVLVEERSQLVVHLLGYGLLVFALIDYVHIIIPTQFTNPSWELQTISALVEHAAIPLLGLMLIFFRHEGYIGNLEQNLLKFLSWVSLLVGVLYLLMLPLGITDTWRMYHTTDAQIAAQVSQQSQQLQQVKNQLSQAKTDKQIEQVLASLAPYRSPKTQISQASKDQFLNQISQAEHNIKNQADSIQSNQTQRLIKDSVKLNLGALVAGTLFILIWHLTDWARIK